MTTSSNDKVILHIFPRGGKIPNMSPPCLKLETYLRMAKIPYECDFGPKVSSKGKKPWVEYKGQEIPDSNFIIEFFNKEFGVDFDDHLTEEQKGMARAIRVMLEENTYWTMVNFRWVTTFEKTYKDILFHPIMSFTLLGVQKRMKNNMYSHGIGRHSDEEIYGIAEKDLRAVSACLGEKKFLFGDKPCLADVALFAQAAQFIWIMPHSPQGILILSQLKNLEDHAMRVKEAFYPDWDEVISQS